MSVKIEAISDHALELGEGPHWDARAQALYFVGIIDSTIHKYTAAGHTKTKLDGSPSFIIPVEGRLNQFVVGIGRDVVVLQWDGIEGSPARVLRTLGSINADASEETRLNDGKADPRGRLYTGSMGNGDFINDKSLLHIASLYRVDQRGMNKVEDKITLSNGIAFDEAAGAMYYVDSKENKIRRYDYDVETGNISNMTYIYEFSDPVVPIGLDGMTIDTDGNLWVAVFSTSCVYQISPRGELLRKVALPAKQITSCTFGGPDLDILFVTTAYLEFISGKMDPPNGCTFKISGLGVRGHPGVNVKLNK